ncbi:MAG: Do family serine endopeptidase [Acidobacteriota bacterium]
MMQRRGQFLGASALAVMFVLGTVGAIAAGTKWYETREGASKLPAPVTGSAPTVNSDPFVGVAARVNPAIVSIQVAKRAEAARDGIPMMFRGDRGGDPTPEDGSFGSGVIVREDGVILTNNHVVDGAESIDVLLPDGDRRTAKVLGTDPMTDLAVLKIDGANLPTVPFADSDNVQVGQWVLALGSPFGPVLQHSVTAGIVSATGRSNLRLTEYEDFIQTDAAINPGNSGGALVDTAGRLIGINTAILSRSGGFQGVGLAIPSNMAREIAQQLMANGKIVRGYLGASVQDVNAPLARALELGAERGVLVGTVEPGGPGDDAGLKTGDVVLEVDSTAVKTSADLRHRVASLAPGTTTRLTVLRDGNRKQLVVKLAERDNGQQASAPERDGRGKLGFALADLTPRVRQALQYDGDGALINDVAPASPASRSGFESGDVIVSINRQPVSDARQAREKLLAVKDSDTALVQVIRRGETVFLPLSIS